MARLKLIKALSYTGEVKATKEKPYVEVEEATAEKLVASGYFKRLDGEASDEMRQIEPEEPDEEEKEPEEATGKAATGSTKKTTAKTKK